MTANLCSNRGHAWKFFAAIALVAVCKMLEFQMSALVLKQLSAFELKAWLGVTLFASYFTDILFGAEPSEYFMLRKALNRTKESTISLHGKHQRATRKALAIQIINCA